MSIFRKFRRQQAKTTGRLGRLSSDLADKLYFIRKKDNPKVFVHFLNENYVARENQIGACMFDELNAQTFIDTSEGFEMVKANEVLQTSC